MAPVMHEWSYEAMATDVLGMQNNVFQYEADTQAGEAQRRTHVLLTMLLIASIELQCPMQESYEAALQARRRSASTSSTRCE